MANNQPARARDAFPAPIPHVTHRRPLHDQFCRCRACKPSKIAPSRREVVIGRIIVAALCVMFWVGAIASFRTLP